MAWVERRRKNAGRHKGELALWAAEQFNGGAEVSDSDVKVDLSKFIVLDEQGQLLTQRYMTEIKGNQVLIPRKFYKADSKNELARLRGQVNGAANSLTVDGVRPGRFFSSTGQEENSKDEAEFTIVGLLIGPLAVSATESAE